MSSHPHTNRELTYPSNTTTQTDDPSSAKPINFPHNSPLQPTTLQENSPQVQSAQGSSSSGNNRSQISNDSSLFNAYPLSEKPDNSTSMTARSDMTTRTLPPKSSFSASKVNRKNLKLSTTVNPKSNTSKVRHESFKESRKRSPFLLHEYKYRKSYSGKTMIKELSGRNLIAANAASIFSPTRFKLEDLEENKSVYMDTPKSSFSRASGLKISDLRRSNNQSELNDMVSDFQPEKSGTKSDSMYTFDLSSDSSEEEKDIDAMGPVKRTKTQQTFRRVLLATYFIGVMFTYRSRIQIYGATRPADHYDDFDETKGMMEENHSFLPIRPTSVTSIVWMLILIFLVLSSAVLTPVSVSFADETDPFFTLVDIIFDIMFGIDIVINFLSAYHDDSEQLITSFKKIAVKYLKGWFCIDLASILPLENIVEALTDGGQPSSVTRSSKLLRLLRFPRLYKMLRVLRLLKIIKMVSRHPKLSKMMKDVNMNIQFVDIFKTVINLIFLNHVVGCIWFFTARLDNFAPNTWVALSGLLDASKFAQYLASLYWSFEIFTTVGFGDIQSSTELETIATICWSLISVYFHSLSIAHTLRIVTHLDISSKELQGKISAFRNFADKFRVPDFLIQKVQRFVEINHKEKMYHCMDSNEILKCVPATLKSGFLLFSYYSLIRKIDILKINGNFTASMLTHFKMVKLKTDEILYREMDPAHEVYFISQGSVDLITEDFDVIFSIRAGTFFGEMEIVNQEKRRTFCISTDATTLLICPRAAFLNVLENFPDIANIIKRTAEFRRQRLEAQLQRSKTRRSILAGSEGVVNNEKLSKMTEHMNLLIYNAQIIQKIDEESLFGIKMEKKSAIINSARHKLSMIESDGDGTARSGKSSHKEIASTLLDYITSERLNKAKKKYRKSIRRQVLSSKEMANLKQSVSLQNQHARRRSTKIVFRRSIANVGQEVRNQDLNIDEEEFEQSSPDILVSEDGKGEGSKSSSKSSSSSSGSEDDSYSRSSSRDSKRFEIDTEGNHEIEVKPPSRKSITAKTEEVNLLTDEPRTTKMLDMDTEFSSPILIASERLKSSSKIISYEKVPSLYNMELSSSLVGRKPGSELLSPNLKRPIRILKKLTTADQGQNDTNLR